MPETAAPPLPSIEDINAMSSEQRVAFANRNRQRIEAGEPISDEEVKLSLYALTLDRQGSTRKRGSAPGKISQRYTVEDL